MSGEKIASIGLPALALVFLLIGLLAHEPADPEPQREPQPFDAELAGAYVRAGCWECHAVSTLQTELSGMGAHASGVHPMGPDLAGVGVRYHPDWHEAHFWKPDDVVAGSTMPAQRHMFQPGTRKLNDTGQAVVKFLLTLKAPSTMNKAWPDTRHTAPPGDSGRGGKLFARECAGCHGATALGDGPAAKFFDVTRKPPAFAKGELLLLRPDEAPIDTIYTIITNGLPSTGMPSFGSRLDDQERADLAAYVLKISGR
jgi:mono/diheme cytochrome c family protein